MDSADVGQPVPGENALDSDDDIFPEWLDSLEECLGVGLHVAVQEDLSFRQGCGGDLNEYHEFAPDKAVCHAVGGANDAPTRFAAETDVRPTERSERVLKVLCWNMRRAAEKSSSWRYFDEMDPDVALLQEICAIPAYVSDSYQVVWRRARGKTGRPQKFGTAILVRGEIERELELASEWPWAESQLPLFGGNLVAVRARVIGGPTLNLLCVYCPAWPIDPGSYSDRDVAELQLEHSSYVWVTELLWAALRVRQGEGSDWLVGGDLNTSATFDDMWPGGPHGNREVLERIASLGFRECLAGATGELVPTFRNPRGGRIVHQMDHVFASSALYSSLQKCEVGNRDLVFGESLSDHLPILASFGTAEA